MTRPELLKVIYDHTHPNTKSIPEINFQELADDIMTLHKESKDVVANPHPLNEEFLREIAKEVVQSNDSLEGFYNYDEWGSDERSEKYRILKKHVIDVKRNAFQVDGETYLVTFHSGGGIGMGEHPDCIVVKSLEYIN